ncbi:MAG: GRP family sugar transporter [Defluviitaleaceae bacterium]|nr:GRP family sugar transporter [Defluviitaleaceae bacterium]
MELWFLYAIGAAIFAGLTTVLAKIGLKDVDSHLATAIRTMVVVAFLWIIVFAVGSQDGIWRMDGTTWIVLILSGLATGGAWLCRFRALKFGNVNKVTPITKSSTILTMLLAFIFLREPLGWITIVAMVLMGTGTWMMLELKKTKKSGDVEKNPRKSWIIFAVLAAVFASLVAIFGSIGVSDMDASLWTAIRTVIVALLSWLMVYATGGQKEIKKIKIKSWVFLVLSGLATGASWLFFYHALQIGNASLVVPIDQLSIVITMGFARLFLGERFSKQSLIGLAILTIGILLPVFAT